MALNSIAFIPDGNRRYSQRAGITLAQSYNLGTQKAREVMEWLIDYKKIKTGTFYTLSLKNLKRKQVELKFLFKIFEKELEKAKTDSFIHNNEVKLKFFGNLELLPEKIVKKMNEIESLTENYKNKTVNLAVGYDGQNEIVEAAKKLALDFENKKIDLNKINENTFTEYLFSSTAPDLILRTSGTNRLSGFMTYQSSYSELYFLPKYWPEFTRKDLDKAITDYNQIKRKFGK